MGNQKQGAPNQAMGTGLAQPGDINMRWNSGRMQQPQQNSSFLSGNSQTGNYANSSAQATGNAQAFGQASANGQQSASTAYGMPSGSSDVPLPPTGQGLPGGITMQPGGGVSFANGDFVNPNGFQLGNMTWNGQQFAMPGLTMNTGANGQQPGISMNGQPMTPNINGLLGMFSRGSGQ